MNALYFAAVAAFGGFFLGRATKKDKDDSKSSRLPSLEGDAGVLPGESPPSVVPSDFSPMWDATLFDVEIYPAGADKTQIPPPNRPDGATTNADCSVVALGELWWDRAGLYADAMIQQGSRDRLAIAERILSELLPECLETQTAGSDALLQELMDRIAIAIGERPQGVTFTQARNLAPLLRSTPYPLFPGTTPRQWGYARNGPYQTMGRTYDYRVPMRNLTPAPEFCPPQPVACQPCTPAYSFNPRQIYTSAAYNRSSITQYRAAARGPRATRRAGKKCRVVICR